MSIQRWLGGWTGPSVPYGEMCDQDKARERERGVGSMLCV